MLVNEQELDILSKYSGESKYETYKALWACGGNMQAARHYLFYKDRDLSKNPMNGETPEAAHNRRLMDTVKLSIREEVWTREQQAKAKARMWRHK